MFFLTFTHKTTEFWSGLFSLKEKQLIAASQNRPLNQQLLVFPRGHLICSSSSSFCSISPLELLVKVIERRTWGFVQLENKKIQQSVIKRHLSGKRGSCVQSRTSV